MLLVKPLGYIIMYYCVLCGLLFPISNFVFVLTTFYLIFRSELKLVPGNTYGKQMENGSWDGVMGMMARTQVDVTSLPLTMELKRSEEVDYIAPMTEYRFVCLFDVVYL
jgi:hypothetical protein